MRQYPMFVVLLLALVSTACGSDPSAVESEPAAGGEWILESMVLEGEMAVPLPPQPLDFRVDDDQVGGSAGCNSMGGTAFFAPDGSVSFEELFWTEMACADSSLMDFEQRYTSALVTVDRWVATNDKLELRGPAIELGYSRRIPPPDLPLTGTTWTLDTFFDGDAASNAVGMDEVTMTFSDDGASAAGRCWTIGGFADIDGAFAGDLTVDFSTADPGFTCDDRAFFSEVLDRLGRVTGYRIDESRLTLSAGDIDVISLRGE